MIMQSQKIDNYGSSSLDPRVMRANRATRKKHSLLGSKVGIMTTSGKTNLQTKRTDNSIRKPQAVLRLATINVGTLVGRAAEVVETAGRRKVDVLALQEVRYKNEGGKYLKGGDFEYKMYWKGENTGQGGVAVMVKKDLVNSVVEVKRVSARILVVEMAVNEKILSVIRSVMKCLTNMELGNSMLMETKV